MKHDAHLAYRVRIIADQVKTAEARLAALYREAADYGFNDLITHPQLIDRAWEREAEVARLKQEVGK